MPNDPRERPSCFTATLTHGDAMEDAAKMFPDRQAEFAAGLPVAVLLDALVLRVLDVMPREEEYASSFLWIERATGLPREVVRGLMRYMRDQGLVDYHCGLWTYDGQPAGAGYAITGRGRVRVDAPRAAASLVALIEQAAATTANDALRGK